MTLFVENLQVGCFPVLLVISPFCGLWPRLVAGPLNFGGLALFYKRQWAARGLLGCSLLLSQGLERL